MSGAKKTPLSGFRGNPFKDLGGIKAFGTLIGGGERGDSPSPTKIPTPSPTPTAIPGRDEEAKKKKGRRRGRTGRESTILAGRLMSSTGNILNTRLG